LIEEEDPTTLVYNEIMDATSATGVMEIENVEKKKLSFRPISAYKEGYNYRLKIHND
jgi:hypothetical protein